MRVTESGHDLPRNDTGSVLWRAIASGEIAGSVPNRDVVRRLADLISAAGVADLVPQAASALPDDAARQARLLNRFRRIQGEKWAGLLAGSGLSVIAIKGLASAGMIWPDPDARAVSDADILVDQTDLHDAVAVLKREGFHVADMPTRSRWGFVSEASFQPMVRADDGANIDLHIRAAQWPMQRALPVADILSAAETVPGGWFLPCRTHMLLIAAAHAAGDGFRSDAVKSVVDGLLLLRQPARIDFDDLYRRARDGRMQKPVTVFLALLGRLGADIRQAEAAGFQTASIGGSAFEQVLADHNDLFAREAGMTLAARLKREFLLTTETPVFLHRNWRRLTGIVRPHRGLPD